MICIANKLKIIVCYSKVERVSTCCVRLLEIEHKVRHISRCDTVRLQDVLNTSTKNKGTVTCERCVCETLVEASECVPQSAPRSASSASGAVFVLASFCASSLILPSTTAWIDLELNADYEVHILRPSYASVAQFAQVRLFNGSARAAIPATTGHI